MPSNRWTDAQLLRLLEERAARLVKFIDMKAPPVTTSREIGMVVSAARLLLGRQIVDEGIDNFQKYTDAREAGLCGECLTEPSIPNDAVCESCRQKIEEICTEADRQYGSLDDNSSEG